MPPPPTSPTILQVLPALGTGGIERGTIEIAEAITQASGRALVASAGGRLTPKLGAVGALHIEIDLRSKSPLAIWRNARRLARLIRQENISLVHARSRAPAWAAYLACRKTRTPFVTTWHGVHSENWPGKKRYNSVLARGDRVIAISKYIADRLRQNYRVGPDRLRLIPRGADARRFDPECVHGPRIQALAEAWALPDDARIIMLPGRLTRWKGQMLLLDALAQLQTTLDQHWICVFVGPADPQDRFVRELQAHATQLGIGERLRFAGLCQDMPAAYAMADVVVIPSLKPEPFGRVVVEAQAMGCPVIVSAQGGAMETILPGETGLLIPPNDAPALAEALWQVLNATPEDLAALAETARDHVLRHYTTWQMQSATLSVYDELLGTNLRANFTNTDCPSDEPR